MRKIAVLFLVLVLLIPWTGLAEEFFADTNALDKASLSVLTLEIYDAQQNLIKKGSGIVVFNNKMLVTTYDNLKNAALIKAYNDQEDAYVLDRLFAYDEKKNIAILGFMSPTDREPVVVDDALSLSRTESVVIIGSPRGHMNSILEGKVSVVYTENDTALFEYAAAIQESGLGSAVYNQAGQLVGMTTAVTSQGICTAVKASELSALYHKVDVEKYTTLFDLSAAMQTPTPTPTPTPKPTATPKVTASATMRPIVTKKPTATPNTTVSLKFPDECWGTWKKVSSKRISFTFQVKNTSRLKTVRSFDVKFYTLDKYGEQNSAVNISNLEMKIKPYETLTTKEIYLENQADVYSVYVAIYRVYYMDGSSETASSPDYVGWTLRDE